MTEKVTQEIIVESGDVYNATREIQISKMCANHLNQHYPGHLWAVNVNSDGGTVNIYNLALSSIYGYLLYMTTVENDPRLDCVMRAGGELIERARMKRAFEGELPDDVDGLPDKYMPGKRLNLN